MQLSEALNTYEAIVFEMAQWFTVKKTKTFTAFIFILFYKASVIKPERFFHFLILLAAEASIRETTSRPYVIQMRHAGSMQPMYRRDAGVWHQTRSLLYKNLLIKWRTKQQSLQVLSLQQTDMNLFTFI